MGQTSSVTTGISASHFQAPEHTWELWFGENTSEQCARHESSTLAAPNIPWQGDTEGVIRSVTANRTAGLPEGSSLRLRSSRQTLHGHKMAGKHPLTSSSRVFDILLLHMVMTVRAAGLGSGQMWKGNSKDHLSLWIPPAWQAYGGHTVEAKQGVKVEAGAAAASNPTRPEKGATGINAQLYRARSCLPGGCRQGWRDGLQEDPS